MPTVKPDAVTLNTTRSPELMHSDPMPVVQGHQVSGGRRVASGLQVVDHLAPLQLASVQPGINLTNEGLGRSFAYLVGNHVVDGFRIPPALMNRLHKVPRGFEGAHSQQLSGIGKHDGALPATSAGALRQRTVGAQRKQFDVLKSDRAVTRPLQHHGGSRIAYRKASEARIKQAGDFQLSAISDMGNEFPAYD